MNLRANITPVNTWLEGEPLRASVTIAVVVLAAVIMVAAIATDRVLALGMGVGFLLFAVFSYYQPAPAVLLAMLLSTDVLKFVDLTYLPSVRLGPAGRFNALDVVVIMLFVLGLLRLRQRHERPLFLLPLFGFAVIVALSYLLGVVGGTTDISLGLNGLRSLSPYLFYIGLAGVIDTRQKLFTVIWLIFTLLFISVVVQLVEASLGQRLTAPTSVVNEYYATTKTVQVGLLSAPYLWNRATSFLFLGLFVSVSGALWLRSWMHALLASLALMGFVVALMRQWYLMVALGMLVIFLLPRKGRLLTIVGLALAAVVLIRLLFYPPFGLTLSYPLIDVWIARLATVGQFQQEQNFIARLETWQGQLTLFRENPLFGYGPGSISLLDERVSFYFSDTGVPNTLVQYGLFGCLAVVTLIIAFFRRAYDLFRLLPVSKEKGYLAGLIGAWVGIVAGYSFGFDFFTSAEYAFATALAMALLDRLTMLSPREISTR